MRVKLPVSGIEVIVGCKHLTKPEDQPELDWAHPHIKVRATEVWVKDTAGNQIAQAIAKCSPMDNFCKRTGRRIAAQRLLAQLREKDPTGYPAWKEDRKAIFQTICPEYFKT